MNDDLYTRMAEAVVDGKAELAVELARRGLAEGLAPSDMLDEGFVKGIVKVGDSFTKGELILPELVRSAEAMEAAMAALQPELERRGEVRVRGRALAGTVADDLHDVGRMVVCIMLSAAGFNVIDLGSGVAARTFVENVRQQKPDLLLLSATLTTTVPNLKQTIEALVDAGMRNSVKVMVGGKATTPALAREIGADGYAEDALQAIEVAKSLVGPA